MKLKFKSGDIVKHKVMYEKMLVVMAGEMNDIDGGKNNIYILRYGQGQTLMCNENELLPEKAKTEAIK